MGWRSRLAEVEHELQTIRGQVEQNQQGIDENRRRIEVLEGQFTMVESTLDSFRGYKEMSREELLVVKGTLDQVELTVEAMLEWAESENDRERVLRLRKRLRYHQTKDMKALTGAYDG